MNSLLSDKRPGISFSNKYFACFIATLLLFSWGCSRNGQLKKREGLLKSPDAKPETAKNSLVKIEENRRMLEALNYRKQGKLKKARMILTSLAESSDSLASLKASIYLMDIYADEDRYADVMNIRESIVKKGDFKDKLGRLDIYTRKTYYRSLGDIAINKARFKEAVELYSSALECSDDYHIYASRGQAYYFSGQFEKAVKDIKKWRKHAPPAPRTLHDYSVHSLSSFIEGDTDKAIRLISHLISEDENNYEHYGDRALFYYWKGDNVQFRRDYELFRKNADEDAIKETNAVLNLLKMHKENKEQDIPAKFENFQRKSVESSHN